MTLSPPTSGTWADVGVTTSSLLAGWKQVLTRGAHPCRCPSLRSGVRGAARHRGFQRPRDTDPLGALALRITRLDTAECASRDHLGDQRYWPIVRNASSWTDTGWQMFGYGTENGDLETAFNIGFASHARYFQIYLADILDSRKTAALEYLASHV